MSDTGAQPTTLRFAVGQYASTAETRANLSRMAESAAAARRAGSAVVAFPEASTFAWQAPVSEIVEHVRTDGDLVLESVARIAAEEGITVVAGVFTLGGDGRPRNTMVAFGPDGDLLARYDKVHLYDSFGYRESDKFTAGVPDRAGTELAVLDLGPFRVGLLNCYDLRFPEFTRALVDAGADTFLISSAWVAGPHKSDHWQTLLRARAIENTAHVVAASQPGPDSVGLSMIIDPLGQTLAELGTEAGLISAELSASHLREVRDLVPSLQHRKYRITPGRPGKHEGDS